MSEKRTMHFDGLCSRCNQVHDRAEHADVESEPDAAERERIADMLGSTDYGRNMLVSPYFRGDWKFLRKVAASVRMIQETRARFATVKGDASARTPRPARRNRGLEPLPNSSEARFSDAERSLAPGQKPLPNSKVK